MVCAWVKPVYAASVPFVSCLWSGAAASACSQLMSEVHLLLNLSCACLYRPESGQRVFLLCPVRSHRFSLYKLSNIVIFADAVEAAARRLSAVLEARHTQTAA